MFVWISFVVLGQGRSVVIETAGFDKEDRRVGIGFVDGLADGAECVGDGAFGWSVDEVAVFFDKHVLGDKFYFNDKSDDVDEADWITWAGRVLWT